MTYVIRKGTESDAARACETVRRSILELCEQDHHHNPVALDDWLANKTGDNFKSWIKSNRHIAIVAEESSSIIGFTLLSRVDGRLLLLYVSPDARFRGVSKAMLAAVEAEAIEAGIVDIVLESTATAKTFYMACGYSPKGGPAHHSGLVRSYPMQKRIHT